MSQIQFQDGMTLSQFLEIYNGEVQYEAPLEQARKSDGIDCLRYRFLVIYNPSISLHSTEPESPDLRNGDFQERCHSLAAFQATWINGSA
jgi:hypothetical protein